MKLLVEESELADRIDAILDDLKPEDEVTIMRDGIAVARLLYCDLPDCGEAE